ncbi:reverse transcriptase domain-containing protein [Tanacetum coccineum]
MGELAEEEIDDTFSDEHLMILKTKLNDEESWYADYVNYIVGKVVPPKWTQERKKRFFSQVKSYFWEEPYAFILCRKVYEAGFYWPSIFRDAKDYVMKFDASQNSGNISSRNEMPQNNIQVCEVFNVWGLDFIGSFLDSRGKKYILVAVDYVSKCVEAQALPTNDACVVVKFLKGLFARFRVPKALIGDRGTHFCNSQLEKALLKYRRSVRYNPKDWSEKLNDALWAFRTTYKTPTGCTPFRMVYRKAYHLPVEIKHKAYWALKQCNMDLTAVAKNRIIELNELMELRDGAYENTRIYKERTKKWHDSRLHGEKDFKNGDKVQYGDLAIRKINDMVYSEKGVNYGVTCEDEAKRRNSGAKMKTFEEKSYQLPYVISSKEDTAYQRQLITSKRVRLIPNPAYHRSPIHRIQLVVSQRSAVNVIDGN